MRLLRWAVLGFGLALAAAAPLPVDGEGPSLVIQPSLIEVARRPGERFERAVTLVNRGDEPLTVTARVADWTMSPEGEVRFLEPGREPRSCAGWIEVEPASLVVRPGQPAEVKVTVRFPAQASGTRWAVVLFALPETAAPNAGRGPTVAARVGLTVYATAEGTQGEDLRLLETSASADGSGALLRAAFEDRGNTAVRFRLTWQIKSADGKFLRVYDVPSVVALPGSRRLVTEKIEGELPPGSYVVTAMARWGARKWLARDSDLLIPARPVPRS
jgi:P pilus assembly chaperone PapD